MNFSQWLKELRDLLPEDIISIFKHGASVGCAIIVFGSVGVVAKMFFGEHEEKLLAAIEFVDHFVLLALVIGLGIEFVGTLYKRIYNSFFHSWVLLA